MISYRKIGGLHWLFIFRFRLAWCVVRAQRVPAEPIKTMEEVYPLA